CGSAPSPRVRSRVPAAPPTSRAGAPGPARRRCPAPFLQTLSGVNVHLTVIIPTFRRPEFLTRALGSVLAQDWQRWEALVVDDGDGEGIEAALRLADPRIAAVANEGRGQVDARSTGLDRARGDIVCWLDDDDWWEDAGHLSLLAAAAAGQNGSFFFRGGWIVQEPDGRREVFDHDTSAESLRQNNTILTSSLAYRRAVHARLGPLDRA